MQAQPKLTKPQMELLRASSLGNGVSASDSYQPVRKLLRLGLVYKSENRFPRPLWCITVTGRNVLKNG